MDHPLFWHDIRINYPGTIIAVNGHCNNYEHRSTHQHDPHEIKFFDFNDPSKGWK